MAQESKNTTNVANNQGTRPILPIKVTYCQGCLMIKGSTVDNIAQQSIHTTMIPQHFIKNRTKRDGNHFHLTLLTQDEMKKVISDLSFNSKDKKIDYIISKANKDLKLTSTSKKNMIHLLSFGIGKANAHKSTTYYCIILWPETLRFRRNLKLSNNTFYPHITIGFAPNDLPNVNKSISTRLPTQNDNENSLNCIQLFEIVKRYSIKKDTLIVLEILELLISELMSNHNKEMLCQILLYRTTVFGSKSQFNDCLNDSLHILKFDPFNVPALISKGIALISMKRPLEAAETFRLSEKILTLYRNAKGDKNQQFAQERLKLFFAVNEEKTWMDRLKKCVSRCRKDTLAVVLNPRIRISTKYATNIRIPNGEIPENISWNETLLPRNFSWVCDGWLCGCSLPKSAEQLKTFEAMNIGLIVTIFDDPLPMHKLKTINRENLKCIHLKTVNYKAPRLFDVERYMKEAEECIFIRNKGVLVHCGGGKGRAGTGLGCFIIKWGLIFDKQIELNGKIPKWRQPQKTGAEVIHHIQTVRPGSIETKEQEQFIKSYANHLWSKVKSQPDDEFEEIKQEKQQSEIDPIGLKKYPQLSNDQMKCLKCKQYCELIILCGIPGSGKTLFCQMINTLNKQQRDNKGNIKIINEWRFANQDKLGKKENVELVVKKWLSAKIGAKIGLIIDRCNVTKKDRKHWIEMTFKIKKTVCIYFDINSKICKERIMKRKNHPTIQNRSQNSIDKLVRDFTRNMEIPTEKEGFQTIYVIKDTNDLLSVCTKLGCLRELIRHYIPTQYFKFPRTPHLWNTGAATRDDICLDAKYSKFYYGSNAKTVIVTEKVDGANIGISLSRNYEIKCQHRGTSIVYNSSCEYSKLKEWLDRKSKYLCEILEPTRHILFGEWCQCKHSIAYDNLPDYFLVFDIYDKHNQSFVSRQKLEHICKGKFRLTRVICKKMFKSKDEIEKLLNNTMSTYKIKTPGAIEGLYLKYDDNDKGICIHRCKLVRSEFIQGITDHWIHKKLEYNTVRQIFDEYDNDSQIGIKINDDNNIEEIKQDLNMKVKILTSNKKKIVKLTGDNRDLYHANMAKSRFGMNLKVICKKLKLDINNLLNVFVIGSRVWSTATSASDWDIIVVTENKNKKKFESTGNIDAYILDKNQWREELNNHRFVCWLSLFLPQDAIWKNDLSIIGINKNCNNNMVKVNGFSFKLFVDTLLKEIDKDCRKLSKFFTKKKMDKVYKTFIHTLRMCRISKEIIILFKHTYGMNKNKNDNSIDIKCEDLGKCNTFVGMIKFDEIEKMVRDKQMQLQMNSYSENIVGFTVDIWINELKHAGKECLNLI